MPREDPNTASSSQISDPKVALKYLWISPENAKGGYVCKPAPMAREQALQLVSIRAQPPSSTKTRLD